MNITLPPSSPQQIPIGRSMETIPRSDADNKYEVIMGERPRPRSADEIEAARLATLSPSAVQGRATQLEEKDDEITYNSNAEPYIFPMDDI